jgi:hypothetical protein
MTKSHKIETLHLITEAQKGSAGLDWRWRFNSVNEGLALESLRFMLSLSPDQSQALVKRLNDLLAFTLLSRKVADDVDPNEYKTLRSFRGKATRG